jgi:four helix bundle protein
MVPFEGQKESLPSVAPGTRCARGTRRFAARASRSLRALLGLASLVGLAVCGSWESLPSVASGTRSACRTRCARRTRALRALVGPRAGGVDSLLHEIRRFPMSLPHHKLVVWQRADDLFIEVHRLTLQRFPAEEKFELGRQLRKSSYSVPANIVEGSARSTNREQLRFFNIASASLSETATGSTRHIDWATSLTRNT